MSRRERSFVPSAASAAAVLALVTACTPAADQVKVNIGDVMDNVGSDSLSAPAERFDLHVSCRPMNLRVVGRDAGDVLGRVGSDYFKDVHWMARDRLDRFRLWDPTARHVLSVMVQVRGPVFHWELTFMKVLADPLTGLERRATTLSRDGLGFHVDDLDNIEAIVQLRVDEFLAEFVHVNEDSCVNGKAPPSFETNPWELSVSGDPASSTVQLRTDNGRSALLVTYHCDGRRRTHALSFSFRFLDDRTLISAETAVSFGFEFYFNSLQRVFEEGGVEEPHGATEGTDLGWFIKEMMQRGSVLIEPVGYVQAARRHHISTEGFEEQYVAARNACFPVQRV